MRRFYAEAAGPVLILQEQVRAGSGDEAPWEQVAIRVMDNPGRINIRTYPNGMAFSYKRD